VLLRPLAKESLGAALARGSFDPKAPAFFSWLGVTYDLERDALLQTMHSIAEVARPGSELVFDYFEADAFVREKQALRVQFTLVEGERVGEPLEGGLDPAALAATLAALGLRLREDLGPPSGCGTSTGAVTATTPSSRHALPPRWSPLGGRAARSGRASARM
jgi:O-methyltransferase involved in polyketide biosynthesis